MGLMMSQASCAFANGSLPSDYGIAPVRSEGTHNVSGYVHSLSCAVYQHRDDVRDAWKEFLNYYSNPTLRKRHSEWHAHHPEILGAICEIAEVLEDSRRTVVPYNELRRPVSVLLNVFRKNDSRPDRPDVPECSFQKGLLARVFSLLNKPH